MTSGVTAYLNIMPLFMCMAGAFHVAFIPNTKFKKTLKYVLLSLWVVGAGTIWLQMFWSIGTVEGVTFNKFVMAPIVATIWTGMTAGSFLLVSWIKMGAPRRNRQSVFDIISKVQNSPLPAEVKNLHLKQVGLSYLAIIAVAIPTVALLASCGFSTCKNDTVRPSLIFLFIGCMIVSTSRKGLSMAYLFLTKETSHHAQTHVQA